MKYCTACVNYRPIERNYDDGFGGTETECNEELCICNGEIASVDCAEGCQDYEEDDL